MGARDGELVHRLWKRENTQVPIKQHRRRRFLGGGENSCVRRRAEHKDHVWPYDFSTDRTEDGCQLRVLAVIDEYTRECLAMEDADCPDGELNELTYVDMDTFLATF